MFDIQKPEQFKEQVRASFDATSPAYGTKGDYHWEFARRLVERSPLQSGQAVLDVATGTGPAAIMAAHIVGPQGRITGVDISPGMVELAKQNIAAAGIANAHVQVGDAEHLDFPDAAFDGILCSSSIVWFPNIPRALSEGRRVLRPGGWLAFSCFGGGARTTVTKLMSRLLTVYGQGLPELNEVLNSPDKCRDLVQHAGFAHVSIATAQEQQFPTDPEASFEQVWSGRGRFKIELLPEQVTQLKALYIAEFAQLLSEQDAWNHDYEQFVVAYRPLESTKA